jgi:DNA-binding NtrC family response regulator
MEQTILAVDDEHHMLKLLERIIGEKTPYPITTVANSLEVPKLLQSRGFDLIITDLKMPGLSGLDLLRQVKEQNRPEEVVIITAFGSMESALEALALGALDYIEKPFRKEQLLLAVDRAMLRQRRRRERRARLAAYDLEPYRRAEEAFCREYVRALAVRCAGDEQALAERSGLNRERIREALKEV